MTKLGFWAHWGPQAQPAKGDWYARGMYMPGKAGRYHYEHHVKAYGHPSEVGFKDVIAQWKAANFTPEYADYLMKLYKAAGAQFFVSIAHHQDNFDLWDSKHHSWNAVEKGPKKNTFGIWDRAARDNGLRLGLTSHLIRSPDWWSANKNADKEGPKAGIPYDGADSAYAELYHPMDWESAEYDWEGRWYKRLKDVIDQHRPDFIYVDGGIPIRDTYGYKLVSHYYNQNMADHNGKLEGFILSKDIVSKNGCLLLNIGPKADGTIPDDAQAILADMGAWLKTNGEAIYDRRPWKIYGEGPTQVSQGMHSEKNNKDAGPVRRQLVRPFSDN